MLSLYYIFLFAVSASLIYFPIYKGKNLIIPLWAISLYGVYQLINWPELTNYISNYNIRSLAEGVITQFRVFSRFSLPTTFGAVLGMSLPIVFEDSKKRKSSLTLFFIMISLVFLTRSMGAILVGAISLGVYFFKTGKKKEAISVLIVFVALLSGVIFLRGPQLKKHPSWTLRAKHWEKAALSFEKRPITGIGWGRFPYFAKRFLRKGDPESLYVHNSFLQFITEGGIIPLIGIFLLLSDFRVKRKLSPEILPSLAGWMIYNLIDIGFYFPSIALLGGYFLSGLVEKREKRKRIKLAIPLIILLSGLPFLERKFLEDLKWANFTGETITISKFKSRFFSFDDEAQLALYRMDKNPEHLKRSVEIYPDNPLPYYLLSIHYAGRKSLVEAQLMAGIYARLYPSGPSIEDFIVRKKGR